MLKVDEGLVDAHVLGGFDRDIYGKALRVRPIERLRGEAKFDSLEALIAQMEKDCLKAKEILSYAD